MYCNEDLFINYDVNTSAQEYYNLMCQSDLGVREVSQVATLPICQIMTTATKQLKIQKRLK